jgi:hypothetical protein
LVIPPSFAAVTAFDRSQEDHRFYSAAIAAVADPTKLDPAKFSQLLCG